MKVLYNQIKELVPGLKATPKAVADVLTMTGIMVDKLESVEYKGKSDYLLGLEVRQNRPDCLGVIGVAREVAAYYGLPIKLPVSKYKEGTQKINISVEAKADVKRALMIRLTGITNAPSPEWLQTYLAFYGINSINLIVDLSNYAMIYTGFPNHVFDAKRVAGTVTWKRAEKDGELETLDGTILSLKKNEHLVIADTLGPLVLASAVGGRRSAVSMETSDILIEVAVYNGAKLLQDARSLNVVTEAGSRLQKDLATEPARSALDFLVGLYAEHAGGVVNSKVSDIYVQKPKLKPIALPVDLPGQYAGIPISAKRSVRHLKQLGFKVKSGAKQLLVTSPNFRTDIDDAADLVEEVVRLEGFNAIPAAEPPLLSPLPDVTPANIRLARELRQRFMALGYDEVYTLPLTTELANTTTLYREWQQIKTQNSINEEFPYLRTSLTNGLLEQQKTYVRKNVNYIRLFEIGTVYGKQEKKIVELEVCAVLASGKNALGIVQETITSVISSVGIKNLHFRPLVKKAPSIANAFSCYEICIQDRPVGILYKFVPQKLTGNSFITDTAFAEFDIPQVVDVLQSDAAFRSAEEILDKLVVLDVTLEVKGVQELQSKLSSVKERVGSKLWSVDVIDNFKKKENIAYTLRVSYVGMTDEEAKTLHENIFS